MGATPGGEDPGAELLGRERELAELALALAESSAGRGQFCLLAGEPGIGKTSLAHAIARRAEDAGAVVRWGRAWEGGGAPAFWPWIEILRGLVRDRDPDELRAWLGPGAGWVAQIVPELREALPDVEPPGGIGSEPARFALFDAVTSFLRNACERPLALMLDDIQAADPATLLMLEFVARGIRDAPIFLLAAYQDAAVRPRPQVDDLIAGLVREARHVVLGRLGREDLARLVERSTESAPDSELVERLHATTAGNPFFANEVVRLLSAERQLEPGSAAAPPSFPLPDTVRDAIRRRFAPLGAGALETLETAAVIGREFRLLTLERATGTDRDELIATLDRAAAADLVVQAPAAPGEFAFVHGLMRETLYGELSASRRIRIHGAVGSALADLYAADPEPHLHELAHHFLAAAAVGHAERAVDYATRAGERAMRLLAYEDAARLFGGALSALELAPPDAEHRAELLLCLGTAQVRAGEEPARRTLIEAARAARALGRPEVVARAALAFRAFARAPGVDDEEVVALLEEGLAGIGDGDSDLRARLLVRLAVQIYARRASERRERLVEEAIAIARRLGDDETLAYVLSNAQLATWGPDTREQALAWSAEVLELAERVGDAALVLTTHSRQVDFLLELDDVGGADVEVETLGRKVAQHPEPRARAHLALQRARRAAIEGRFDEAEALIREGERLGARVGDPALRVVCHGQRWGIRWSQGRLGEVEGPTRQFADALPGMPVWRAALALVYCEVGREPEARRELERLAADDFAAVPRNDAWLLATAILAEIAVRLDDAERARPLYELLLPFAERNVVSFHGLYLGPVARYLGILAATAGDWDAAEAHLAAALRSAAKAGARPVMEIVRADEARIREERRRAGAVPAAAGAAPSAASLRREGDVWLFDYSQRAVRVRDSKGVRYLARLLEAPGAEIHALELVGGDAAGAAGAGAAAAEAGLSVRAGDDGPGPALDAEAKAAYRERLAALREEVEEAESFNDPERAARAREELEFVARELAGAVGLGGRDRKTGSSAERARVNVTRSIRTVMKRIQEFDPELGRELESTVRTGTFCSYEPDPRRPVSWTIEAG